MSKNSIEVISEKIVRASRELHNHGLVRGTSGNISAKIPGTDKFLIKPSGARMEALEPGNLILVDLHGNKIGRKAQVSLETPMHAAIYRVRKDVTAVIHTHPPTATAFGIAKTEILPLQIEMFLLLPNGVPIVPFEKPGSKALARAVQKSISHYDAIILENHGIVTVGVDIEAACTLNEIVEEAAKIQLSTIILAGRDAISLTELKEKFKIYDTVQ